MSGAPAFSIVIPAYNYAHFLRRAVTSACTQDGADVEVLVVDDGSTDDTPAVMDKLSAEFGERLTYHRQPNQGPAAARAKGLALARHDWLGVLG
ncbi:MAG TPA: glycosyltransferase family 2 protein, partial [Alcanivorax sp.]|nr:glycosyltransferase family 2 protein [Alcanivorax sp.]